MKDLIKKILKEETEKVLRIPGAQYFGGVEGLRTYIETKNIKRWSLDDDLNLYKYKGDLTWIEGLVSVSGSLDLFGAQIESLGNLQSVGGSLDLRKTQIKDLGNLQSVGRNLDLEGTQIESLGNLQSVGGYLDLFKTKIKDLGNLKSVGSNLDLEGTQIESLGNLQSVDGSLWLNKFLSTKYTDEKIRSMINVGNIIIRP